MTRTPLIDTSAVEETAICETISMMAPVKINWETVLKLSMIVENIGTSIKVKINGVVIVEVLT